MRTGLQRGLFYCLLLALLTACSSDDEPATSGQQYYFLEALQQVEAAGRQLQTADLTEEALLQSLACVSSRTPNSVPPLVPVNLICT